MRVAVLTKFAGRSGARWLPDDLVHALAREGASVDVFVFGRLDEEVAASLPTREVRHVGLPSHGTSRGINRTLRLGLAQVRATAEFLPRLLFRRYDRIVVFSALFPFYPILPLVRLARRRSTIVGFVWDFYPAQWQQTGRVRNRCILRLIQMVEGSCVRSLHRIAVMTPANLSYLRREFPRFRGRLDVVGLWRDVAAMPRPAVESQHLRPAGYSSAVMFGGTLSAGRDQRFLVDLAQELSRQRPDVALVIAGGGDGLARLRSQAAALGLSNLHFLGHLTSERYLGVLRWCTVGLVVTDLSVDSPSFPSKSLDYMWAALPILAVTNPATDFGDIIERVIGCGLAAPFDASAATQVVSALIDDASGGNAMGEAGRRYLHENMQPATAARWVLSP